MDMFRRGWQSDFLIGFLIYIATTVPVVIGVGIARHPAFVEYSLDPGHTILEMCCRYDGDHFTRIVEQGYRYDPGRASSVAFFPGYPLLARVLVAMIGSSAHVALLVVANASMLAAMIITAAYLRTKAQPRLTMLWIMGLWPVGFCFRLAYSDSLFLATVALLMLGWARRWPLTVLALIAGASTGIRAVGVAASAAVLLSVLLDHTRGSLRQRLITALAVGPIACWGLLAYMTFQLIEFNTPLAFAQTQRHWSAYHPQHAGPIYKAMRLAIGEPIWDSYVPGSMRHWTLVGGNANPLHGTAFWNPILFVLAVILMAVGWRRRWLTREETVLGLGLLFIPYVSRADEQSMISHARFAAVVLPAILVFGRMLAQASLFIRCIALALFATFMMMWTALFASGWPLL
jgi:hypothetical protein